MKKVISVTLAAVLLFTAFVTVFSFNAAADATELLGTGSFDGAAGERVSSWQQLDNSAAKNAPFVYAEENGRKFASGAAGGAVFKQITLKANVSYTVSFEARFLGEAIPENVSSYYRAGFTSGVKALANSAFVGPNATGNKYYSIYGGQRRKVSDGSITDISAWATHTFTYTPTADLTTYFAIGSYDSDCKATLQVDNAFICKTEDLVTVTATAGEGGSVLGGGTTYKGNKLTLTAVPNTGFELFAWLKDGKNLGNALTLEVAANENTAITAQFAAKTNSLNLIPNGDFNTGLAGTFQVGRQGTTANFEQDLVQAGNYCLKGEAGLALYAPVSLKAGTAYTMTFDFKFSGTAVPADFTSFYRAGFVSGVGYLSGSAFQGSYYSIYAKQNNNLNNWQTHTVTFTPTADFNGYAVVGTVSADAASAFYLDNWQLAKTSDFKTVTLNATQGGTVSGPDKAISGSTVTVQAGANTGYTFEGWYAGDAKMSNDMTYTFTVTENVTLTAKFKGDGSVAENLLINGDFESGLKAEKIFDNADSANAQTVMKNNAGKWGRLFSGITVMDLVTAANYAEGDNVDQNGNAYLKTGSTADGKYIRGLGQFVYLEKGSYVLQFDAKNNSSDLRFGVWSAGSLVQSTKDITVLCKAVPLSESWTTHSYKFTVSASQYYQIGFGGNAQDKPNATLCLDNIALYSAQSFVTVTTIAEQGGSVSDSVSVLKGQAVTIAATPAAGYSFVAWRANGSNVSANTTYTFTPTADITLTATFKKDAVDTDNLLENGDFETPLGTVERLFNTGDEAAAQEKMAANAGKWGRLFSTVTRMEQVTAGSFEAADSADYNGTRYLKSGATKEGYVRGFGQFVKLEPGNYTLSFIARSNRANFFEAGVWNTGCVVPSNGMVVVSQKLGASTNWCRYTMSFTVKTAAYYQVGFGQNGTNAGAEFCLDNVVLCKTEKFLGITTTTNGGGSVSGPLNTVKVGDVVTITAVPDENYSFSGWFLNGKLITAEPSYTFTVSGSATYEAKFNLNLEPDKLVQNGDFEFNAGSLLGWETVNLNANAVSLETESQTGNHAAVVNGGGFIAQRVSFNKGEQYVISFDAKFSNYTAVPSTFTSFFRSGFTNDLSSLNASNFIGPAATGTNKYFNPYSKNTAADNNWHTYTYSYEALNDLDCWLVFGCVSNKAVSAISFDNICIYTAKEASELKLYAVSAGGSGSVQSDLTGFLKNGTAVHLTATANKGSVFGGWYQNEVLLSKANPFTYTCNSSEPVYAKFFDAKTGVEATQAIANSSFEDGLTGWTFKNIEGRAISSTLQKEGSTNYVRLGKSDMLSQTVELQNGYTYRISVVSRADPKNVTLRGQYGDLRFSVAKPGTGTTKYDDALDEGESDSVNGSSAHTQRSLYDPTITDVTAKRESLKKFNTYTYEIGNYTGKVLLADIVVGIPYYMFPGELEVASITIARFSLGVSNYEPTNLYGEEFYNAVANSGFGSKTTNADWGQSLPAGWQIKTEKGNAYLSVKNSVKTYEYTVYPGAVHLISMNMRTKALGASRVEIVDSAGNVLGDCVGADPRKAVLKPTQTNTWQRLGMEIYIPFNVERIYLRIVGAENALDLDDITIVRNRNATLENMNVASMADYNYNTAKYYNPTLYYTADGVSDNANSENAATGDNASPVLPLAVTAVATTVLLAAFALKPRKKLHQGEVE